MYTVGTEAIITFFRMFLSNEIITGIKLCEAMGIFWTVHLGQGIVNRGNGYETRQSSLLYVFVLFFGLDPAQNTIVVYSVLRN